MNKAEIDKLKAIIKDKQKEYEDTYDHYIESWANGLYDGLQFTLDEIEKLEITEEKHIQYLENKCERLQGIVYPDNKELQEDYENMSYSKKEREALKLVREVAEEFDKEADND